MELATSLDVLAKGAAKPIVSINVALTNSQFSRGGFQQQGVGRLKLGCPTRASSKGNCLCWVICTASWNIPESTALPYTFQTDSAPPALWETRLSWYATLTCRAANLRGCNAPFPILFSVSHSYFLSFLFFLNHFWSKM